MPPNVSATDPSKLILPGTDGTVVGTTERIGISIVSVVLPSLKLEPFMTVKLQAVNVSSPGWW